MTTRLMTRLAALSLAASACAAVAADAPRAPKWDVSAPPGMATRQVPIDVDQGTWMNVDASPDGQSVAFVSDRGGGDNIWIMSRDGSNKQQVSKEDFRLLNQPGWTPDSRQIVFWAGGKIRMLGGWLYDPMTMNEVVTGTRIREPYWWERSGQAGAGVPGSSHSDGDS